MHINIQTHTVSNKEDNKLTVSFVCVCVCASNSFYFFSKIKTKQQNKTREWESQLKSNDTSFCNKQLFVSIHSNKSSKSKQNRCYHLCCVVICVCTFVSLRACVCACVRLFFSPFRQIRQSKHSTWTFNKHDIWLSWNSEKFILWQLVFPIKNKSPNWMHSSIKLLKIESPSLFFECFDRSWFLFLFLLLTSHLLSLLLFPYFSISSIRLSAHQRELWARICVLWHRKENKRNWYGFEIAHFAISVNWWRSSTKSDVYMFLIAIEKAARSKCYLLLLCFCWCDCAAIVTRCMRWNFLPHYHHHHHNHIDLKQECSSTWI